MQNEDALKAAIATSATWEDAVDDFIACTTSLGQPFTSGHVTTIMRVYRPEFRFKHEWVGNRCQDKFYNGDVKYNGDDAVQVTRVCAGLGRTPAGTPVFCYAADEDDAEDFPFELDIPEPGANLSQMPQEHPVQPGVRMTPKAPNKVDMRATIHTDHRLCVPRIALEGLMHATNTNARPNGEVYVRFEDSPERAVVSFDQKPNAVNYQISKRGRVLFPKAGSGQFNHGDIFAIEITNDELVIDISNAL